MPDFYQDYFAEIERVQFQEANRLTILLLLVGRLCEINPEDEDLLLVRDEIDQLVAMYEERLQLRKAFEQLHRHTKEK